MDSNSPARRFCVSNHEMRQRDAANRSERRSVGCGSFESRRRRWVRWGRGIPGYRTRLPLPRPIMRPRAFQLNFCRARRALKRERRFSTARQPSLPSRRVPFGRAAVAVERWLMVELRPRRFTRPTARQPRRAQPARRGRVADIDRDQGSTPALPKQQAAGGRTWLPRTRNSSIQAIVNLVYDGAGYWAVERRPCLRFATGADAWYERPNSSKRNGLYAQPLRPGKERKSWTA
jgi:hypothetical protein